MSIELAPTISGAPVCRWKRYPAYRDSGVEWLGAVPEGWELLRTKQLAQRIQTGSTPPTSELHYYENGSVPWFGPGSFGKDLVLDKPIKFISKTAVKDGVARIFKGQSTMIVTIGATIGKVGYIESSASSNQQITVVTFDITRAIPKFAAYQMKRLEPVLRGIAPNTTLPILNQDDIGHLPFCLPTLPEQHAIAALLDRETGRIDTLIEKKERQIELLQEKRAALISHAVTKGRDPDVKMKGSGVEWLGKIPEEWEVIVLRRLLDPVNGIKIGPFGSQLKSDIIQPTGFKVYGQENVIARNFDLGYRFVDEDKFKELAVCEIIPGDIVVTMMGTTGRCQVVPKDIQKGIMDSHLLRIRINEMTINPIFLEILIDEALYIKHQIKVGGKGSIMHGLNSSIIKSLSIVLPSLPEQHAIAAFLDRETGRIDTLTTKLSESISKLREYRTALISAAVTGKIDVREDLVS